jgi:hypothetical protein
MLGVVMPGVVARMVMGLRMVRVRRLCEGGIGHKQSHAGRY